MAMVVSPHYATQRPPPLTECPSAPEGLAFAAYWYRFPRVEDFWICTKCYEDKIFHTQFAGLAEIFYNDPLPGQTSICDFNSDRVDQILARAVRSNNIEPLFSFAGRRSGLRPCDGVEGLPGGQGVRWFSSPDMPHFVACEACYEDFILASSFTSRFERHPMRHPAHEVWVCDVAIPFIRRNLLEYGRSGDWQSFVITSSNRLSVPACSPKPIQLSNLSWFRPIRPSLIPKMMICEACFLDNAGSPPLTSEFAQFKAHQPDAENKVLCSFRNIAIKTCNQALLRRDHARWHYLVSQILFKPDCAKGEMTNGEWYTLPDPNSPINNMANFDICGACYIGLAQATNHATIFRKVSYPSNTSRVCDFSPAAARFKEYVQKWSETIFTGNPSAFIHYVSRISEIPPCLRSKPVPDAVAWWGMDTFFFCLSCYQEAGRDTYFAASFTYQGAIFSSAICDMYTANMRRRYVEACRSRSLDGFLNFCAQREQIRQLRNQDREYQSAVRKARKQAKMQLAINAAMIESNPYYSSQMSVVGSIQSYASGWDPNLHPAHPHYQQSHIDTWKSSTKEDPNSHSARLEKRWRDVE